VEPDASKPGAIVVGDVVRRWLMEKLISGRVDLLSWFNVRESSEDFPPANFSVLTIHPFLDDFLDCS